METELQDDIDVFHRKIRFQSPVADGAQHLAPHVITGDERLAIERVVDAARRVANPDEMVKRAMRKAEQMGWPDQMDVEEVEQSVRGLILAALGITTEDTHKHEWIESLLGDGQVCQVGDCGAFKSTEDTK